MPDLLVWILSGESGPQEACTSLVLGPCLLWWASLGEGGDRPLCPVSYLMTGDVMRRWGMVKSRYQKPDLLTPGLTTPRPPRGDPSHMLTLPSSELSGYRV